MGIIIKKKKLKSIIMVLALSMIISMTPNVKSYASNIIKFKEVDGQKCVNIVDYAKAMGAKVDVNGDETYIFMNGKGINIYENEPFIYVNGNIVALKTEKVTDYHTGEEFDFPMPQKPVKDENGGFLIPVDVMKEQLGVKVTDEGLVVEKAENDEEDKKDDNLNEENKPSNGDSSNNGGSSNSGSANNETSNKPNNGGSSNGSTNNKPNNGGSNDSSSNNGSSNNKPNNGGSNTKPEKPQVNGLTPKQFENTLTGMGWKENGTTSLINAYIYYGDEGEMGRIGIRNDNSKVTFQLINNSPTFDSVIKRCFKSILPTQGNKLYDIVSNSFNDQTLNMDGKTVVLSQSQVGVTVEIYYPK